MHGQQNIKIFHLNFDTIYINPEKKMTVKAKTVFNHLAIDSDTKH